MEIKDFIMKFAEAIEVENASDLTSTTKFHDLEEWSSLSVMLLIAFFDEEFDKQVDEKTIRTSRTIQDLYNILDAK